MQLMYSDQDCTLEGLPHPPVVRLGLRSISGLKKESAEPIAGARREAPFVSKPAGLASVRACVSLGLRPGTPALSWVHAWSRHLQVFSHLDEVRGQAASQSPEFRFRVTLWLRRLDTRTANPSAC